MTVNRRLLSRVGLALAALSLVGFAAWMLSLPQAVPAASSASAITQQEADALVSALKPTNRQRPLVAIIGINDVIGDDGLSGKNGEGYGRSQFFCWVIYPVAVCIDES